MRKLCLKLEELAVESFEPAVAAPAQRGTVRGAVGPDPIGALTETCDAQACANASVGCPDTGPQQCPSYADTCVYATFDPACGPGPFVPACV